MSLGKPSGEPESLTDPVEILKTLDEMQIKDVHQIWHMNPEFKDIQQLGDLIDTVARLEEEAGIRIPEGEIKIPPSISQEYARSMITDIRFVRLGRAHLLVQQIVKCDHLKTVGDLLRVVRKLAQI
ncbi:MAG: hypothetical protein GWP15_01240 [Nitrospirae bacterium]|nr:hypothetical protein [Nitrospirota bacterium]